MDFTVSVKMKTILGMINEFVNKPFSEDNLIHSISSYLN